MYIICAIWYISTKRSVYASYPAWSIELWSRAQWYIDCLGAGTDLQSGSIVGGGGENPCSPKERWLVLSGYFAEARVRNQSFLKPIHSWKQFTHPSSFKELHFGHELNLKRLPRKLDAEVRYLGLLGYALEWLLEVRCSSHWLHPADFSACAALERPAMPAAECTRSCTASTHPRPSAHWYIISRGIWVHLPGFISICHLEVHLLAISMVLAGDARSLWFSERK